MSNVGVELRQLLLPLPLLLTLSMVLRTQQATRCESIIRSLIAGHTVRHAVLESVLVVSRATMTLIARSRRTLHVVLAPLDIMARLAALASIGQDGYLTCPPQPCVGCSVKIVIGYANHCDPERPLAGDTEQPRGELSLRTLAMPADANPAGDIFGGWLLAQMDIAGGLAAKVRSGGRVATVAINAMKFHRPVLVGDVICCYANLESVGRSSMRYHIQAWALRQAVDGERIKVTEGEFTFVAIDEERRPRVVPPATASTG